MTTVLLTGASGFLGGHLLRELRATGCEVRALSRRSESDAVIAAAGAMPVRAALADQAALAAALEGCAAVFHAAADTSMWRPRAVAQTATNVQGTANLLRAAGHAGVQAFMHTSSVSAWSHRVHGIIDESAPQQGGGSWINYERSKFLGEQLVRGSPLPWIVFNPSHILGPGDRHNWARLIMLIDREKLPGIPPGVGAFADVREIARAQVRAWQRQRFGQTYLLGGEQASFVDFVHRVGAALGRRTPRRATPAWALMGFARVVDAWSRLSGREPDVTPEAAALTSHVLRVDSGKARRELDYVEPPLDVLLADMLDWMRGEGMIGRTTH
ncbi:NAD-dependent epimerase/dehydratase family protein [Rhodanobacter ginsengisoli]|uniref:NAD-dependent epimerase/dehydratase family protein n=1 Tax=Rhodanobacter ginsengisoli TaxID=418646 RepID=A0ABW0QPL9_9GAMM